MKSFTCLGIFAHPDDETFGPGGTLIKLAEAGHKVYTLTATRGQAGQSSNKKIYKSLGAHRTKELKAAVKAMGLKRPTILDFHDGTLNENSLPVLMQNLRRKIKRINPDIIIIFDFSGTTLHLDHIAVTKAILSLYDRRKIKPKKIYCWGLDSGSAAKWGFFSTLPIPPATTIDVTAQWERKQKAMQAHISQEKDVKSIIANSEEFMKNHDGKLYDYFQLVRTSLPKSRLQFPESDLITGL